MSRRGGRGGTNAAGRRADGLNFLQRVSGIATLPAASSKRLPERSSFWTWQTTPGLRVLENTPFAPGATNPAACSTRFWDNHIRLAGGVTAAICAARTRQPETPIEIEAETLEQVDEALAAGVQTILVDNMDVAGIREAVKRSAGRAKIEISGGVTLDRVPELAATGADFVSAGALTHSAQAVDISFEIEPVG
jgi:nicotinate-nucleotide pyrophosphorylase (carboxylating)